MAAHFGPAGMAESFKTLGYKKTLQLGEYLNRFGLDHFEYQCGQGVHTGEATGRAIGAMLREHGITVSIHAPYFISLSGLEEEKRLKSVDYILATARLADYMGGDRIVIHSGSCGRQSREQALTLAKGTLQLAREALVSEGLGHIRCCPETMGKVNQLGDLQEVMELCKVDESFLPCIDFGHLNARTFGSLKSRADFAAILDTLENELGSDRARSFHSHFSKIQYTPKGGEKCHLTFADTVYGPDYEPLMELIRERDLSPTIICESAGTQTEDATTMMTYYKGLA